MDGFLMDESMFRQVIMDHYNYPQNKVAEELDGYIKLEGINPSCGDQLTIFMQVENGKIKDIKFLGSGCSICCASASVMTQEINEMIIEEAIIKIDAFKNMVTNKEGAEQFEDAQAFLGVYKFPARFKCAFLSWDTARKILEEV